MAKIKNKTSQELLQEGVETIFGYTPLGEAHWCKYLEPDQYGNYSVDLYLNDEDTDNLIEKLEELRAEAVSILQDNDKEIGKIADVYKTKEGKRYFQFKVNKDKQKEAIPIYSASGKLDEGFNKLIGNGSEIVVQYMAYPYYLNKDKDVGITLRLRAIQVVNLVKFSSGSGFADMTTKSKPQESGFTNHSNRVIEQPEDDGDEEF